MISLTIHTESECARGKILLITGTVAPPNRTESHTRLLRNRSQPSAVAQSCKSPAFLLRWNGILMSGRGAVAGPAHPSGRRALCSHAAILQLLSGMKKDTPPRSPSKHKFFWTCPFYSRQQSEAQFLFFRKRDLVCSNLIFQLRTENRRTENRPLWTRIAHSTHSHAASERHLSRARHLAMEYFEAGRLDRAWRSSPSCSKANPDYTPGYFMAPQTLVRA